jgi:STE24 endopeptidase
VRLGVAAIAAVIVAEGAVWLLRPRGEVVEPVAVSERSYFSTAQVDRAESFRSGQRLLGVGTLAIEGGVLVTLALWRPQALRNGLRAVARRPLLGGAAVGAALSISLSAAALPTGIAAHERARDVGLATQDVASWLGDVAKSTAIGAAFAGLGGALAVAGMRRLGDRWWIGGSVVVVGLAVTFSWLAPVVLAPVFNRFEELPPGATRSEVVRLGKRAGVDVGEVYRVDASRRSTALNAYVNGLGPTKRVVIFDNALRELDREELSSLIAHELGHVKGDDIWRGIAWIALVAPLGVLFVQVAGERLARRRGDDPRSPAGLPALALVAAATVFVLGVAGNQLSRRVEARADTFALELTHDPQGLIGLQRRLAITNLADPDPPAVYRVLFGTHPDTLERIGAAVAFERESAGR